VRGAILHEPGLYALVDDFDGVRGPVRALSGTRWRPGGRPPRWERFWAYMTGEAGWNRLAPALRERLRATAGTLFAVELGTYELYLPDEQALAAIVAPVRLLVSEEGLPVHAEVARRFSERLGVDVAITPGSHDPYHEYPDELAAAVRPFMRAVSAAEVWRLVRKPCSTALCQMPLLAVARGSAAAQPPGGQTSGR
jgi:pimeloyl-ACP methyl ester carboxylesterase